MNNKKICFITCVNDDRQYEECLLYINNLNIPEGYEIDVVSIKEAESMIAGYNAAMQSTDAKYKVYLHQDTFIINKNFILDMLSIFEHHEKIGLMGVAGAKTIPTNGVWWDSIHKYGKVYESHTGKMELTSFNDIKRRYENVKAIDGLIMITQYDIPWREDIFDGWNFYDISQSMEFNLAGYEVVIPNQYEPWCIHDCGSANTIDECDIYRSRFLNEYSKDMFSLVSVLIPTYNRPQYLQLALESVLNQTYKNIEIIIGDDSTNNETEKLIVENYLNKYDNIKYYHNEKNLGQFDNDIKLYNMANGEFINYLMDDDLFEITKIEKMMNYFIHDDNEEISLVTSHRAIIDSNGSIGQVFGNTDNLFKNDTVIGGIDLGSFMLKTNFNCIGEPTTALFRKNKLKEPFGVYNNRRYGCNVDQATWFNLLSNGKAVFINEVLSYFRIHDDQQLASDKMKLLGALDYAHEVLTAREKGFLMKDEGFITALSCSYKYCQSVSDYFDKTTEKEKFIDKINELREKCKMLKNKHKCLEISTIEEINIKENNLFYFDKEEAKEIVNNNKKEFNNLLEVAKYKLTLKDYEQASRWCHKAAMFAVENHPGFYTSNELENILIECANNIPVNNRSIEIPKSKVAKRKVLHVLSEGYAVGGHTKLVENWIEKDKESEHSLVATWQIRTAPTWLLDEVKASGGWNYSLEDINNFIDRAATLRKLANEWADVVVLHIHMFDPIPVMAFGVEGGPPVLFVNHADHLFSIGSSVSDRILDGRNSGKNLTVKRRNVKRNEFFPLPLKESNTIYNDRRGLIREKAGISEDTIVLLTIASEYKFKSFGKIDYIDILKKILLSNKNVVAVVIGPEKKEKWAQAFEETEGRLMTLGVKKKIEVYYDIADIYLDSFIFTSPTSVLDAAIRGIPIVTLKNDYNETLSFDDYGYNENGQFKAIDRYINYIEYLIKNKNYRRKVGSDLSMKIKEIHVNDWKRYLNKIYENIKTKSHNIYLNSKEDDIIGNDDMFLALFQNAQKE